MLQHTRAIELRQRMRDEPLQEIGEQKAPYRGRKEIRRQDLLCTQLQGSWAGYVALARFRHGRLGLLGHQAAENRGAQASAGHRAHGEQMMGEARTQVLHAGQELRGQIAGVEAAAFGRDDVDRIRPLRRVVGRTILARCQPGLEGFVDRLALDRPNLPAERVVVRKPEDLDAACVDQHEAENGYGENAEPGQQAHQQGDNCHPESKDRHNPDSLGNADRIQGQQHDGYDGNNGENHPVADGRDALRPSRLAHPVLENERDDEDHDAERNADAYAFFDVGRQPREILDVLLQVGMLTPGRLRSRKPQPQRGAEQRRRRQQPRQPPQHKARQGMRRSHRLREEIVAEAACNLPEHQRQGEQRKQCEDPAILEARCPGAILRENDVDFLHLLGNRQGDHRDSRHNDRHAQHVEAATQSGEPRLLDRTLGRRCFSHCHSPNTEPASAFPIPRGAVLEHLAEPMDYHLAPPTYPQRCFISVSCP